MTKSVISPAQREFISSQKKRRQRIILCQLLIMVLFAVFWEAGAALGAVDAFIFSSPSRVAACLMSMASDGSLFLHTGVTLAETLISFAMVVAGSLAAALALWALPTVSQVLEPYLVILNSLPKSALAPLLIVWLGSSPKTIVAAAVSVAIFGSVITLHNGFLQTDPEQIKLIYSLGGKKQDVLRKLLLPSSVPLIISSMKVNIGLCLVGVIIGEFLAADAGLGYLIIYSSQTFRMTIMIASILVLCAISAALYRGITAVEKRFER